MSTKLKILYFASLRDKLNTAEESMMLDRPKSVREIKNTLLARDDKWQIFSEDKNILAAINHEMVKDEAKVANGDELAFFPPVTGG